MEIIVDTREKHPWNFVFYDVEIIQSKLDYGDYTTENLKNSLVIERKASVSELANNVTLASEIKRFGKELEVIQTFPHRYIICEFPESKIYQFPKGAGLPKKAVAAISFTGQQLRKIIGNTQEKYDIPFIFCANRDEAESVAYNIIDSLEKKYARNLSPGS